jgi:hypothetical protein
MKRIALVSPLGAALALLLASGALAAVNPAAPNPYPERDSKLLVDFTSPITVMGDPAGAGKNIASINSDPQFTALGTKSLKVDLTGVNGYHGADFFVIPLPAPVDIQGYRVLGLDVFLPDTSIDPSGYYQLILNVTTTNPGDDTKTTTTAYGPRLISTHTGWNHVIWNLVNGTDTKITQLAFGGQSDPNKPFSGPIYVDNIRVYKGDFVGLQPDEKLVFGFDNSTDASLFTSGDGATITVNTDKQFITQGTGSLTIDMTGLKGYQVGFATASDLGISFDVSKATALHLDLFVPVKSAPTPGANGWHLLGFSVTGDAGGMVAVDNGVYVDGQWNTLEIPLNADQQQSLGNVTGIALRRDSGDIWNGPIYIDNLRAVFPPTAAPTAGG